MKTIQELLDHAFKLLDGCNTVMKDNAALPTLNSKLVGIVKDLNDARIKEITGVTPNKDE
jgi:hypothetical protein